MSDNFIDTHTHSNGLETELLAAEKAEKRSESIKARIIAALHEERFIDGITPDEFSVDEGILYSSVVRRFTDLWKEGKIKHHPEELTRLNSAYNECVVWVLGEDTVVKKPTKIQLLNDEVSRLRAMLQSRGIDPDQTSFL